MAMEKVDLNLVYERPESLTNVTTHYCPGCTHGTALRSPSSGKTTAAKAISSLCESGVLEETSGRARDRTYSYRPYLDLLKAGTEVED